MKASKQTLYLQIIQITQDYLGPATERFIDRQIQSHLDIQPKEISTQSLLSLMTWIRIAFSLLTEDLSVVDEYCNRLEELARK
jgi:septation ring formation regulator EzrA